MTYQESLIALADPTRRKIFEAVASHPQPVSNIARFLPVSRPAVSQHLKVLSDAGLVSVHQKGTRRFYSARREGLAELRAYLDGLWGDVLNAYANSFEDQEGGDHEG